MDEEMFSRPHAHPMQAAPSPRAVGVPEQRSPNAPDTAVDGPVRPVMSLARLTLAVIFGMLLIGVVVSFILTRA
jgi:hypothetical protein